MWLIDSGASNHYTSLRHILSDFRPIPRIRIITGKGYVTAVGIGNVTLHTSVGLRTVFDVMWVPELTGPHHLLSIPQLISKRCDIRMSIGGASIYNKDGILLVEGVFTGKGFLIKMAACIGDVSSLPAVGLTSHYPSVAMLAGTEDTQPIEVWHMRLGHLNQTAIQQLTTHATGLHIGPARPLTISMKCDSCLRGSQHKQISYSRGDSTSTLLEHVWSDLKGPLLDNDVYGFRFFVIFVDEKSRYTKVFPLLAQSDAFNAFKVFEARAERVTGRRIINLHVDGGGEFLSGDFRTHCRNRGIEIFPTQAYSPEMNSIAERMNRTIIEHASSMLWAAGLPIGFWAAAVKTSVFLTNRSPASALRGMTPFEAYFGTKPNLGFLRVWGCRAAAHVPLEIRTKTDWSSKSTPECIFIGYSDTENLYELWDVAKAAVIRKRDVIFWENELGHPTFASVALPHGVSIFGGTAGKLVPHLREDLPAPPTDNSVPVRTLPLAPLPVRQTVSKLPPEQTIAQQASAGNLTFIPYVPPLAHCMVFDDEELGNSSPDGLGDWSNLHAFLAVHSPTALSSPLDHSLPATYYDACRHPDATQWKAAMERELQSLRDNDTWELVDLPAGRRAFPNKWVYSYVDGPKANASGVQTLVKARLVARGDLQKPGIDYKETFAPVVKFVSLRVLLTYAALRKFSTRHYDITSAFLHGDINLEIYMKQPMGFDDGTPRVCRLKKAIYGLCQAARQFYKRLDDILTEIGYSRLAADWAIWFHSTDGNFIAVHVDDMFAAGTPDQLSLAYTQLTKFLRLKDFGEMTKYLGLAIGFDNDHHVFSISQGHYARKILNEFDCMNIYTAPTPMCDGEKWDAEDTDLLNDFQHERYRSAIGMLLYLMHGSRPDLCYPVIKLSQYSSRPRKVHWDGIKRIFRYLRGTLDRAIHLGQVNATDVNGNNLIGYFDSAHADTLSKRSTCGYLFTLYGGIISWSTKVQRTIALSSTEAEYMAGTEATREAVWLKGLLDAVFHSSHSPFTIVWPVELREDNQGSLALANNPQFHKRTKHIELRHRFLSDMVADGLIRITYVPTTDMLADSL